MPSKEKGVVKAAETARFQTSNLFRVENQVLR